MLASGGRLDRRGETAVAVDPNLRIAGLHLLERADRHACGLAVRFHFAPAFGLALTALSPFTGASAGMIYQFQFLRFVGAVSVLLFHTAGALVFFNDIPVLFKNGPAWVCFFFLISGFFAYLSTRRAQGLNTKQFYLDKIRRLYPIYAVGLAAICIYSTVKPDIWLSVLLLQAWVPKAALSYNAAAWYMSNIFFCYLIFPLLFACYQKWKIPMIALSLLAALYSYYLYGVFYEDMYSLAHANPLLHAIINYCPLINLPNFMIGISIAVLIDGLEKRGVYSYLTCVYALALIALFENPPIPLYGVISGPFFAPLVVFIFLDNGWLARLFSQFPRMFNLMGEMSYPLYIMHVPVAVFVINKFSIPAFSPRTYAETLLLTLALSLLLCVLQARLFPGKARMAIPAAGQRAPSARPQFAANLESAVATGSRS